MELGRGFETLFPAKPVFPPPRLPNFHSVCRMTSHSCLLTALLRSSQLGFIQLNKGLGRRSLITSIREPQKILSVVQRMYWMGMCSSNVYVLCCIRFHVFVFVLYIKRFVNLTELCYLHPVKLRYIGCTTVQQHATYSVYYISVGSSTCFRCWHPSSGAHTTVITASGID